MLNGAKLRELYYRVIEEAERPLPKADMMYLVGETRPNQSSVLDRASEFSGLIGIIGYEDTEQRIGYPGSDVWMPELLKRSIPRERIVPIMGSLIQMGDKEIIHTLSEMRAMVRHTKELGIRNIIMVAPRFHILRAFMSGAFALSESFPELRLFPVLGTPLDWNDKSSHSQGSLTGTRADFLVEEMIRIYSYHAQENLPDPEDILAYMDRRDTI